MHLKSQQDGWFLKRIIGLRGNAGSPLQPSLWSSNSFGPDPALKRRAIFSLSRWDNATLRFSYQSE